ncbi:hypothetical protein [Streptomyces diastatochromogenes]|uniref:hypothetical protein n=1 Tax=Streptomyces diastatochromogenes TaxID=42236 RepID=UPI00142E3946|nr:hypothetical protein [Streptomyces diastatochromogenes]MCZ0991665.1 hypothetical protein [Streptomyces diastatochromogenes]
MAYVMELPLDEGGDGAARLVKVEVQEKLGDGLAPLTTTGSSKTGRCRRRSLK